MTADDHHEMRQGLSELRGDFREAVAQIRGAIEALAAVKTGEIQRLDTVVSNVAHDAKTTKAALSALHDRLDGYPRPAELQATFSAHKAQLDEVESMARANQLTLAKLIAPGAVGGAIVAGLLELATWVGG